MLRTGPSGHSDVHGGVVVEKVVGVAGQVVVVEKGVGVALDVERAIARKDAATKINETTTKINNNNNQEHVQPDKFQRPMLRMSLALRRWAVLLHLLHSLRLLVDCRPVLVR